ncbi:MAG: hypothetical protein AAFU80_01045 [Pseudomonadota bacterium]
MRGLLKRIAFGQPSGAVSEQRGAASRTIPEPVFVPGLTYVTFAPTGETALEDVRVDGAGDDLDALRELRLGAYRAAVDTSRINFVEDVFHLTWTEPRSGLSEPRLPIDPAHVPTEIVVQDHAFTGRQGFVLQDFVRTYAFRWLLSERVHDIVAPTVGDRAQFFPVEIVSRSGKHRASYVIPYFLNTCWAIAKLESGYRPRVVPLPSPGQPDKTSLRWSVPPQGAARPEQFLTSVAVAGQEVLETVDVPPYLLFSERVAAQVGVAEGPGMVVSRYRVVEARPEPTVEDLV